MSLNFKALRRSFSLRNNAPEDKSNEDIFVLKKSSRVNEMISFDDSIRTPKLRQNSLDNTGVIDSKKYFNLNMEYLLPYTRQKNVAPVGMHFSRVKQDDGTRALNTNNISTSASIVSDVNASNKKQQKQVLYQHLKNSAEVDVQHTKISKKQLKFAEEQLLKLKKINIHLHALFSAVENGHSDKAKSILESTDVNVNCVNSDALSPLDVAVLSNNRSMTKILLQHGATHGTKFKNSDSLGNHLNSLLQDALNKIKDMTYGSTNEHFENGAGKQIDCLQRRVNGLQRIMCGWVQTSAPQLPSSVIVDVTSSNSVSVKVQESFTGSIATKFKIQWSTNPDFYNTIGERELNDLNINHGVMISNLHLYNLNKGQRYYFRASSGNVKGWSQYCLSTPNCVIPSSWRDSEENLVNNKKVLEDLYTKMRSLRTSDPSETQLDIPLVKEACVKRKATIKQLFSATSKFQKNLKRGLYLACVLYNEGKVLVTNDDFLPVIEIDENYPNNLYSEFAWLMKLTLNWDMVKSLRNDMEKKAAATTPFRLKLLTVLCQMQSTIGIKDLGHFYYKTLNDSFGTVVISCIKNIKNPKSISVLNSRWVPLRKIQKKLMPLTDDSIINEIVLSSIQSQIEYHQSSDIILPKGLYIGYLKMQCSLDQMYVVVPTKTPNNLPHCKIRDNPHICAEEWDVIRGSTVENEISEMQKRFLAALTKAARRIFKYMGTPTECMLNHKLYNVQVIELSHDVTFLIICPPLELSCSAPGEREMLLQRGDLFSLPTLVFEMSQIFNYDNDIIRKCARLSLILEWELTMANHCHRQAFSQCETRAAKEHLTKLQEIYTEMSKIWMRSRWLMNVMTFTRNRSATAGIKMRTILGIVAQNSNLISDQKETLIVPHVSNDKFLRMPPCRLSWPNSYGSGFRTGDHSKSEQELNSVTSRRNYRTATEIDISRRNSADSSYRHCFDESVDYRLSQLSASKSDEILASSRCSLSPLLHRKRSKTVNAASSYSCLKSNNPIKELHGNHKPKNNKNLLAPSDIEYYVDDHACCFTKIESNGDTGIVSGKCSSNEDLIEQISKGIYNTITDGTYQLGTIQVHVKYKACQAISLKLHITTTTTAREIIDLVVKQFNMTVLLNGKDKPIYINANLNDFCLYAVFGCKGRFLQDDFRPLQLQNPWRRGRLYVRQRCDVLDEIKLSK